MRNIEWKDGGLLSWLLTLTPAAVLNTVFARPTESTTSDHFLMSVKQQSYVELCKRLAIVDLRFTIADKRVPAG